MATKANGKVDALGGDVSNAGADTLEMTRPYTAAVTIQGTARCGSAGLAMVGQGSDGTAAARLGAAR